jgi:hypothetical protein
MAYENNDGPVTYQWTTGNLVLDPGVFAYDLPRMCHRGLCGNDVVEEAETAVTETVEDVREIVAPPIERGAEVVRRQTLETPLLMVGAGVLGGLLLGRLLRR